MIYTGILVAYRPSVHAATKASLAFGPGAARGQGLLGDLPARRAASLAGILASTATAKLASRTAAAAMTPKSVSHFVAA